ncbi:chlorophyll a/b-binding protein [Synechococcus sp. ROS8604]|jgi:hypothetical protein|uniref:chlorophyll a/b-binding protein n=1 Tax=Synechococcus sp. ROS8604 TaxID=1442557 RepID=UPI0016452B97|nr:chlorophyll a/b-binding protein [Synechococcus sp. ROS8604]QNI89892.1 high light inducible protein [Synechococcus sp. ROS8604]
MNKPDQVSDRTPEEPSSTSAAPEPLPTSSATTKDVPAFGWSAYAERINGRFAMIGFLAVVLTEALSGDTFLHWAGLIP